MAKLNLRQSPIKHRTRCKGSSRSDIPFSGSHNPPSIFFFSSSSSQDFYCSEEMSQDISFSPFINIASPKCNYQGRSDTSVC